MVTLVPYKLVPYKKQPTRKFGQYKGQIEIKEDFDTADTSTELAKEFNIL